MLTVVGSIVPSRSLSLAVTAMTTVVSSSVLAASSLATGGILLTVRLVVSSSVAPSLSVTISFTV